MKTVNVNVTIQLDVESNSVSDVQNALDFINSTLQHNSDENYNAQIFVNDIDSSNIMTLDEIEIGDEVEVPEPNEGDGWRYSFVGELVDIRGEYGIVTDMDGDSFTVELNRLSIP